MWMRRFSHVAEASDTSDVGYLGPAQVTGERWSNLAPQSQAGASNRGEKADRINNGMGDAWQTWDNVDGNTKDAALAALPLVSAENPAWVMLAWPTPVKIDGLFVAAVFEDKRQGKTWAMPVPSRNMSLKGFTLSEENFWPTWSQTPDGKVYVMNGAAAPATKSSCAEPAKSRTHRPKPAAHST